MSKIESLPIRLRKARIAAGFRTATEFCNKFKIPVSTYSMHETGRRKLMPKIAEKYSEYLEVNPAWLITGIGTSYSLPNEIDDATSLLEEEYINFINYKGNKKIPVKSSSIINSLNVDPEVFSKIIIEIINVIKEFREEINLKFVTFHAISIYQDIANSSSNHQDCLTMVSLAATIFRKKFQKKVKENKKR